MQKNQPTIYISSKSMETLQPYILPYICNFMKYKLIYSDTSRIKIKDKIEK